VVRNADRLVVVWTGLRRGGTFFTLCAGQVQRVEITVRTLPSSVTFDLGRRGL
jgi:hypothetical protein